MNNFLFLLLDDFFFKQLEVKGMESIPTQMESCLNFFFSHFFFLNFFDGEDFNLKNASAD